MESPVITHQKMDEFLGKLQADGKSNREIAEYRRNLASIYQTAKKHGYILNKKVLEEWKTNQIRQGLASGTVTNRVVKINHFLRYSGWDELCFPDGSSHSVQEEKLLSWLL